jgi:hypothetical protein
MARKAASTSLIWSSTDLKVRRQSLKLGSADPDRTASQMALIINGAYVTGPPGV